jgi:hypothetical protein
MAGPVDPVRIGTGGQDMDLIAFSMVRSFMCAPEHPSADW